MAEDRIRRRLQFGILDLLIVTTIVAVAVFLSRPEQGKAHRAPPRIVGGWMNESDSAIKLVLLPDGYYSHTLSPGGLEDVVRGAGWKLSRHDAVRNQFLLECGTQRFVVRSDLGTDAIDVLNEDASVRWHLVQYFRLEGPMCDGLPHGTWRGVMTSFPEDPHLLEYRHGELVDCRVSGMRNWLLLNQVREARGFPERTERDFPDEVKTESHETPP